VFLAEASILGSFGIWKKKKIDSLKYEVTRNQPLQIVLLIQLSGR
jgi:hypothetical protein